METDFVRIPPMMIQPFVENAIKHGFRDFDGKGKKGKISIEFSEDKDGIVCTVTDNGIGISKADQRNLFQPFFRAGNVQSINGNGLGLTIVREAMKLHHGEVTFTSIPDKGSTFVLRFPGELVLKRILFS